MKRLFTLLVILSSVFAFSGEKPRIETLFQDLPPEERIARRLEFIEDIRQGKEKNYLLPETTVLYALNLKDNAKHAPSWYEWIHSTLAAGRVGEMRYTAESLKKAEGMLKLALKNAPNHLGLQLIKLRIQMGKGVESYKLKSELDKYKLKVGEIDFQDLFFMADLYMKQNDPNSASDIYKAMEAKAVSDDQLILCYQGRGLNAKSAGNWNDCVDAYKKSDELFRNNQFVLLSIVQCLNKGNRFTEALIFSEKLKESADANCAIADAQIGKGAELGRRGKFTEAEELINKSLKCIKWEAYHELTHLKLDQSNFEAAYEMMLKSAGIRSAESKNAYFKGWAPYFRGNLEFLKKIMEKIIDSEKTPEDKLQGYHDLTKFLLETKDPSAKEMAEKGIAFGTESLKANAENYPFLKALAGLLTLQGKSMGSALALEQAQLILGKLSMMNPNDTEVREDAIAAEEAALEPVEKPSAAPVAKVQPAPVTQAAPATQPTTPAAPTKPPVYGVPSQPITTAPAFEAPTPIQAAPAQQIESQPAASQPIPVQ